MDYNTLEPPDPPPCRVQCGTCGYTANKSEYKHICWAGIFLGISLALIPLSIFSFLIYKILGWNIWG